MDKMILDLLGRMPTQFTGIIFPLIIFFFIAFNLIRIVDSVERFRRRKQKIIDEYFNKDVAKDERTEAAMVDLRDTLYFESISGIYAEKKLRHTLMTFHANMPASLDWRPLKRALKYLKEENGQMTVAISLWEMFLYIVAVVGYFLMSFIFLFLLLALIIRPLDFVMQPKIIFLFASSLVIIALLLNEIWSTNSAIRIWGFVNKKDKGIPHLICDLMISNIKRRKCEGLSENSS